MFTFFLAFVTNKLLAQEYNYIHYTAKDGLASNTVYDIAQDDNGFIYFATDNGLSRFDGKEWKTFTVKDGLPDNEILGLYFDKQKRLWLFFFNKKCCYFKNGILYDERNSTLVKQLVFNQPFQVVNYDDGNRMFMQGTHDAFEIIGNNCKRLWPTKNKQGRNSYFFYDSLSNTRFIGVNDSVFIIDSGTIVFHKKDQRSKQSKSFTNRNLKLTSDTAKLLKQLFDSSIAKIQNETYLETNEGCLYGNLELKKIKWFLKGIKVGHHYKDKENNNWFTTMDDGVYKLISENIIHYSYLDKSYKQAKEVYSLTKNCDGLLAGSNFGIVACINNQRITPINFQSFYKHSANGNNINRLVAALPIEKAVLLGFDGFLCKTDLYGKMSFNYKIQPNKSIAKINDDFFLIATGSSCVTVSTNELSIKDTIWHERTTCADYYNFNYYVGTLNGLFKIDNKKQQFFLGNLNPRLTRRITCIKNSGNYLVVATADSGVAILQNDKVIKTISETNGLNSNICKTLFIKNGNLYIGTVKGLVRYSFKSDKIERNISVDDGLPSNIINAIYVDDDSVIWVGSPEGLTKFHEKDIVSQSMCKLVVDNIQISGKKVDLNGNTVLLKYNDDIKFNFAGISFRSSGIISYHYKLVGFDNDYKVTTQRVLNYPSLPPGNYTLNLYAKNKYGVQSKTFTFIFIVIPPFWKTWWFYTLEILFVGFIIWLILFIRFRRKKKEYKRVADFKVQLAEMEQQALQSQMNPHFIFNCLNSIQQFILSKENDKAFNYLLLFSRLVRSTLDNSEKLYISLSEEMEYVQQYLMMEDLRFGEQFTCKINVDKNIDINESKIPAMILQPFIENALRHGIRQLENKKGLLKIDFQQSNNKIYCIIEDNGIGRKAAMKFKSNMHINYQSKGMDLTQRRINLLNENKKHKIEFFIIDLEDENGVALGTKVIITFPDKNEK